MKTSPAKAGLVAVIVAMAGTSLQAQGTSPDPFRSQAEQMAAGPAAGPRNNATSFAEALRCMDGLFRTYGTKGVSVVLETIPDETSKVKGGAKDMFMSATSQMTRGSRAIKLIPWDERSAFTKERQGIITNANYAVQGSISQFDENILRKQRDGAICLGPLCLGAADSDAFSGMSLDLNMIETEGMTLLPGVSSKNYVLIRRKGRGLDGDLTLSKFGVNYNFTFNSSDGQGQALRALVELSGMELYGRLLKIPYWSCLGRSDSDPPVVAEIDDWWEGLSGDLPSLVSYFQVQMQARGLYKGEIDGQLNESLKRAIRAYKVTMGGSDDLTLDAAFFRQYLAADHAKLQSAAVQRLADINAREGAVVAAAPAPAPGSPTAPSGPPPAVTVTGSRGNGYVYKPGEPIELEARLNQDGYLYCYYIDENRQTSQFFPNPARPSAAVKGSTPVNFPGNFGFRLSASKRGNPETVACIASPQDLGTNGLPKNATVRDAATLRDALRSRLGSAPSMGVLDVKVQ